MENNDLRDMNFKASSPERKVLGEISNSRPGDGGNALSPTANLKLLTKVASNFERNSRESDSLVSTPISSLKEVKREFPIHCIQKQYDENSKSRKDKSLSLLCNR